MAGNVFISTGLRNQLLGNQSLREILRGGYIDIRDGSAPATADAAITGTQLVKITRASLVSKVAQVATVTPAVSGESGAVWDVTIHGVTVKFTDDSTPSVAEICTGLAALINAAAGGGITTPAGVINNVADGIATASDDTTLVTITAAAVGVPFDISSEISAGGSSGTLVTAITVLDAYGLSLEAYGSVASGIIEKAAAEVWSGLGLADGTAGYFRYVADSDTGALSTTEPRIQGVVSTSNAPLVISSVNIATGATETVNTFQITLPAS
jgi:hypothetical protein